MSVCASFNHIGGHCILDQQHPPCTSARTPSESRRLVLSLPRSHHNTAAQSMSQVSKGYRSKYVQNIAPDENTAIRRYLRPRSSIQYSPHRLRGRHFQPASVSHYKYHFEGIGDQLLVVVIGWVSTGFAKVFEEDRGILSEFVEIEFCGRTGFRDWRRIC